MEDGRQDWILLESDSSGKILILDEPQAHKYVQHDTIQSVQL